MSCTPTIQYSDPPSGSCVQPEVVAYLRGSTKIVGSCDSSGAGVLIQNAPPSDTTKVWLKTDGDGVPLFFLSYVNGAWRRVGGGPGPQAVAYYKGPIQGVFDIVTGIGLQGEWFDGWQIKYSNANKFIICAQNYDSGGWKTEVTGDLLDTGGVTTYQSAAGNTWRPIRAAMVASQGYADGNNNTGTPSGNVYTTLGDSTSTAPLVTLLAADAGNPSPAAVSIVPPFVAYVEIEYIGI